MDAPSGFPKLQAERPDARILWHGRLAHACRYSDTLSMPGTIVTLPPRRYDSPGMLELADEIEITAQMGRKARCVVAVAARCPAGHPSVITCYPLRRKGNRLVPFPTLYWLTCPRLSKELSHLERDGAIATIGTELARDHALPTLLLRDHADYIARRWATLSAEDQLLVSGSELAGFFQTRGIGGMTNFAAVKCLHLHFAHQLVSGNVLGELVARRYGLGPCHAI